MPHLQPRTHFVTSHSRRGKKTKAIVAYICQPQLPRAHVVWRITWASRIVERSAAGPCHALDTTHIHSSVTNRSHSLRLTNLLHTLAHFGNCVCLSGCRHSATHLAQPRQLLSMNCVRAHHLNAIALRRTPNNRRHLLDDLVSIAQNETALIDGICGKCDTRHPWHTACSCITQFVRMTNVMEYSGLRSAYGIGHRTPATKRRKKKNTR